MAIYKFNPVNPGAVFSNPNRRRSMVRGGESFECSTDFAASINAAYEGIDGAPALALLDPPKPARKPRKPRKPKAEG